MRMRKNVVLWVASLAILLGMVGCVPTDVEMNDLHNNVDVLNGKIDEQQAKLTEEIDRLQGHVAIVNDAMKKVENLPEKVAAGIEASRPFNPYADEMTAILGLTTVIGGLFYNKEKKKRTADKVGRENALRHLAIVPDSEITSAMVNEVMFRKIGDVRGARGI